MNNKVTYANEATVTSTRTGTEVVAEIDNFKFEQYLDAFIAKEAADYVLLASMGTTMNIGKAPRLEPI